MTGSKDIPLVLVTPNVGMCVAGTQVQAGRGGPGCLHQQTPTACGPGAQTGVQAGPAGCAATRNYVLAFTGSLGGQNAAVVSRGTKP